MILLEEYFGRVSRIADPSDMVVANATDLLSKVNALLTECVAEGVDVHWGITSGWRPASYNAGVPGAAPNSRHISGQAVDVADPDGALDQFLFDHQQILMRHELWMEHPLSTKGWTHLSSVPPKSGNRVFFP